MDKTQQVAQLRLAADIIETGHPWEYQPDHHKWQLSEGRCPLFAIQQRWPIRLVLATPPDSRPLHNPDNLTADQVGTGYRLLTKDEFQRDLNTHHYEWWSIENNGGWILETGIRTTRVPRSNFGTTYRVPLSVPWPEVEKPDPYADLKAAHAAGKVVQVRSPLTGMEWVCDIEPEYGIAKGEEYRIKPTPTFQLPPPPPGMCWHREDGWEEGDLPQGWRSLVDGERLQAGDAVRWPPDTRYEIVEGLDGEFPLTPATSFYRTRRLLTFEHAGKQWTWHRPGDPMPCDGEAKIRVLTVGLSFWTTQGKDLSWANDQGNARIIGWRYADEKKTVPLGPEDVKPFTVIRRKGEAQTWHWRTVSYVDAVKVTCGNRGYGWIELASSYERNESLPLTGKWNPSAWEPCSKPA